MCLCACVCLHVFVRMCVCVHAVRVALSVSVAVSTSPFSAPASLRLFAFPSLSLSCLRVHLCASDMSCHTFSHSQALFLVYGLKLSHVDDTHMRTHTHVACRPKQGHHRL